MKNKILINQWKQLKISNENGVALIFSYLVLSVLFVLVSGFAISNTTELTDANRYRDETAAFWAAGAGVNRFLQDTNLLNGGSQNITIGAYSVALSKNDTDPTKRILTAVGSANGTSRELQLEFPANPPEIFDNAVASGGNLNLVGFLALLEVNGITRLTGNYTVSGIGASATFTTLEEGVAASRTTFTYPDADNNTTPDEFTDFVQFNKDILATYPASEVVYIQNDNTQTITPNSSLAGKKVIFVEGSAPGAGDVNILFDSTWEDNQNMTVISTGTVTYIQPLQVAANSQLNTISWDDYTEASVLYSAHSGVTYTHDTANFYSIFSRSDTTGNLIANSAINANEALAHKVFDYDSPLEGENVPPGFQGLVSQAPAGYSSTPDSWKEI